MATAPVGSETADGTASAEEIARFSAMADQWWDPAGQFRPLHELNPLRLAFVRDVLCRHFRRDPEAMQPLAGLSCLDLGCGGGLMSEPVARLGAVVTGVDASATAIRVASTHAESQGLDICYRWALPEELSEWDTTYDVVLALEVVEHVQSLDSFFQCAAHVLRPDGVMIVATLNRTLKSLALAKVGAEYLLRWLPVGTHDWRKFVRPSELARAMRRHGLSMVEACGMSYDPLRRRWALSKDLDVNYIASAVGRAG
jgi:2-polyprenyl-6-hydroxyphenyl methylase/3-demethylubiquinone-9 3-methyltransferase